MPEDYSKRVSEVLCEPMVDRVMEEVALAGAALLEHLHPRVTKQALYGRQGVQALIDLEHERGVQPPSEAVRSIRAAQDCACMKADVRVPQ